MKRAEASAGTEQGNKYQSLEEVSESEGGEAVWYLRDDMERDLIPIAALPLWEEKGVEWLVSEWLTNGPCLAAWCGGSEVKRNAAPPAHSLLSVRD